jgi:uncharacterized alkaline shock family protein YloU
VTSSPVSTATTAAQLLSLVAAEAEVIAATVRDCPSVVDLAGGRFGEVATYLPGKRITGVRVTEDRIDVHLVGRYGIPIPVLAVEIRAALTHVARGRAVDIRVEDLWMPPPAPA